MKELLFLYKEKNNKYYPIHRNNGGLWNLYYFFSSDYRVGRIDFYNKLLNFYNVTYIYNDFKYKILYIGFAEWAIDENIESPEDEDFPNYVNEFNSCKISYDNFMKIALKWELIATSELPCFALIYRNDNYWIDCKGFNSQEEMEQFVKNHTQAPR